MGVGIEFYYTVRCIFIATNIFCPHCYIYYVYAPFIHNPE